MSIDQCILLLMVTVKRKRIVNLKDSYLRAMKATGSRSGQQVTEEGSPHSLD